MSLEAAPGVTFYVLDEPSSTARLRLACRLTEKAFRAGHNVLIWHSDASELAALDELLWTCGDDRTFIPHERVTPGQACEAPVLLTTSTAPEAGIDVLINLAADVPQLAGRAARILEIIDGDAARREAGRSRFKAYRERGWQPVSHSIRDA
ncbi:MAG TPA: DNA polymerase III subunit chi [Steroidobacteraceae bacterium]|nr:DNA polymerase III subunit chi [Steroidobacteraceae bacterium]